ncbi:Cobyric acid synthase [Prochlorococcus marinus str. MIT 9321]|uniref:Cobyric acid synthase n=1 Tax=Prochlorococcus marinus str. MIT 9401 TaxID=167551 RepID=A0A0A2B4T9_PROMR|nr:cobyric acid synthase [Prochlorococcus marinus]KGG02937.1 Cobyric acid synthase [Prochlorococcus marinus str. MIT 9321]KGG05563.1 Cobyric acid synthase [Prochlorococcus marinus str. MIT 9322]KGG07619.1 Cobyric acid synthase [Prochlorococcus marinus str. MIT 9401]
MDIEAKLHERKKPIMVLGTSSGAGKSLTVTAICRILKNLGEEPIPFKGQNMSNNAWVDGEGGEMAYSQALQAFACGINPSAEMNPILLKPQGNSISEVIHLGKSIGTTTAQNYYKTWFIPGWEVIKKSLKSIYKRNPNCRLIIEGAGSPVEMNLIHRDLTNLRVAKYLNANCILVTDIERGGVFAQIIGTLELMKPEEKKLIKGIIINRFRGDLSLFANGKKWIENKTQIPVIGIIPWLNDSFPPEDSLDLIEKKLLSKNPEIKVGIIKLPSISNFSDFDPLENEESIFIEWIKESQNLNNYDFIIIPGSKQTFKDQIFLENTGLSHDIRAYSENKGNIIGICGGLQMLGETLEDPHFKEGSKNYSDQKIRGIGLLPLKTIFFEKKLTRQIISESLWPCQTKINGFEIHNGQTELVKTQNPFKINPIFKELNLGWYKENKEGGTIAGTYIHGIFENDIWRDQYINLIRERKKLPPLKKKTKSYKVKRESIIENLANEFNKHLNLSSLLN